MTTKSRIPEGGAMTDNRAMSIEDYSRITKNKLGKQYVNFAKSVINLIQPDQNSKVLEIGPGPGWAGIELLSLRPDLQLDGLEASPDMVRVAFANAKTTGFEDETNYRVGTVENMMEIPDNYYDLVISFP